MKTKMKILLGLLTITPFLLSFALADGCDGDPNCNDVPGVHGWWGTGNYGVQGPTENATIPGTGVPSTPGQSIGVPVWPLPNQTNPVTTQPVQPVGTPPVHGPSTPAVTVPSVPYNLSTPPQAVTTPRLPDINATVEFANQTVVGVIVQGVSKAPSVPSQTETVPSQTIPPLNRAVNVNPWNFTGDPQDIKQCPLNQCFTIPLSMAGKNGTLAGTYQNKTTEPITTPPETVTTPGFDANATVSGFATTVAPTIEKNYSIVANGLPSQTVTVPGENVVGNTPGQYVPSQNTTDVPAQYTPFVPGQSIPGQPLPPQPAPVTVPGTPGVPLTSPIPVSVPVGCYEVPWVYVYVQPDGFNDPIGTSTQGAEGMIPGAGQPC